MAHSTLGKSEYLKMEPNSWYFLKLFRDSNEQSRLRDNNVDIISKLENPYRTSAYLTTIYILI